MCDHITTTFTTTTMRPKYIAPYFLLSLVFTGIIGITITTMNRFVVAGVFVAIVVLLLWVATPSVPAPIAAGRMVEGGVYACDGRIIKIQNGQLRWYPNPTIYNKYGAPPYTIATSADCAAIPPGPNFE